jgi:hypothetical protein
MIIQRGHSPGSSVYRGHWGIKEGYLSGIQGCYEEMTPKSRKIMQRPQEPHSSCCSHGHEHATYLLNSVKLW